MWYDVTRGSAMAKTETIRARVEPELKREAEAVLKALGLNASEAITLFYRQVALRRGLPFEIKLPNETTRAAIRDALEGKDLTEWSDLDELKAAHG
jgi:DNA-damage-inducible protein J